MQQTRASDPWTLDDRDLKNTSKNTLTRNEEEFMEGIHALYQISKSTRMTYNRLADQRHCQFFKQSKPKQNQFE
jgi:hypothetical protein